MSIICGHCGHSNQEDAAYCDECGEELVTDTSSYEEEDSTMSSEENYTEASSTEESDEAYVEASSTEESDDVYVEASSTEESDDESEVDTSLQPETEIVNTEESEESRTGLPIGAATRLEIEEPPIKEIASPPTTLELPELPTAVLIDQETGERFIIPSEEKTAYIGRINDEFPVQIDLSGILNADLISRVHAAIHREDEVYYVEDAGSANGTWLNETELQSGTRFRKQLNPGDTIAFGRSQTVKFTFDLED
ncbi:MAG: FHA domain-containing protein [Xenococcaceae cyanobacterium MO_167.B52]|nr:FHA domain-containing protein [Xenococcaceae cyanobacterium MO_167.B52]